MVNKRNKQEYELFSKLSDEWWDENGKFRVLHQIRPIRIQYILDQFNNQNIKNLDILDLGCGGGLVSESLSRLGANVTGLDFVEKNIEIAKIHSSKKNLKINYICDNIEQLKLNKKFDLIIMFEVLEHLNNWESLIGKIKKNLKSNGLLIISTINRNIISKYMAIYFAEYILKWIPKGTHNYENFIKPEEIDLCVKKNNFIFKNLQGLVFDPVSFNWKLSNNTKINYFCTYSLSN